MAKSTAAVKATRKPRRKATRKPKLSTIIVVLLAVASIITTAILFPKVLPLMLMMLFVAAGFALSTLYEIKK